MARIAKKSAKMNRVKAKKGAKSAMPSADEMQQGMDAAAKLAALQKKRGFKKRRKARRG